MLEREDKKKLLGDGDVDDFEYLKGFYDLALMASQVSLATFCRIALTSIDNAFLGHLGTRELAASALAQVWTGVPLMGVWAGASALITLCGQSWGANNRELTGIWLQFGIVVTGLLGIPVFVWYWNIRWILRLSTPDEEIVRLGVLFGRYLSLSIAPSLVYACMRQYFQAMGIMWPTTIVGSLSIGVAAVCNYVFIYGIGSWNGLGFIGSPLATVMASWFQPIALYLICVQWKGYHKQAWSGWDRNAYSYGRLKTFLTIAGPMASNSLVSNLANSMVALVAAHMGSNIIAANAVISGLWGLLWAIFWGFGCATQVFVANYMGAGKPKSAKKIAGLGLFCAFVTVCSLGLMVVLLDDKLFRIYTNDPVLITLCVNVKWLFALGLIIESVEMLISAVLTGMSKINVIFYVSILATWFINLPLCWLLGLHFKWGLPALWVSIVIMEVFKLAAFSIDLGCVDWAKRSRMALESMEVADAVDFDDSANNNGYGSTNQQTGVINIPTRTSTLRSRTGSIYTVNGLEKDGPLTQEQVERRIAAACSDRQSIIASPAHMSSSLI